LINLFLSSLNSLHGLKNFAAMKAVAKLDPSMQSPKNSLPQAPTKRVLDRSHIDDHIPKDKWRCVLSELQDRFIDEVIKTAAHIHYVGMGVVEAGGKDLKQTHS